ncbi:hypothetical protein CRG98_030444 [Punica granatum]|uniref:Uncharacterized protein n=1 Tax=Punica granatum TaxID=22663 RepID=A0A2I0J0F4_PUNGR|nr:hypothetical protein CRG98_030444 [Punica granatum]
MAVGNHKDIEYWRLKQVDLYCRQVQKSPFKPGIVSIGESQGCKLGKGQEAVPVAIKDLEKAMRSLDVRTRACYQGRSSDDIPSDDFIQMMITDGCFIIELLCACFNMGDKHEPSLPALSVEFFKSVGVLGESHLPWRFELKEECHHLFRSTLLPPVEVEAPIKRPYMSDLRHPNIPPRPHQNGILAYTAS